MSYFLFSSQEVFKGNIKGIFFLIFSHVVLEEDMAHRPLYCSKLNYGFFL